MRSFEADLCVMAYVTLLVPQPVLDAPKLGTIQYHPSLLPQASRAELDQLADHPGRDQDRAHDLLARRRPWTRARSCCRRRSRSGRDDTLGSLYFNHLFPMGVDAIVEAIDLVRAGKAPRIEQDDMRRRPTRAGAARPTREIDWSRPAAEIHNLIRGTDPQPGAWTVIGGNEVQIYDFAAAGGPARRAACVAVGDEQLRGRDGGRLDRRASGCARRAARRSTPGEFAREVGLAEGSAARRLEARSAAARSSKKRQGWPRVTSRSPAKRRMLPIGEVAARLEVPDDAIQPYGRHIAKVGLDFVDRRSRTGPTAA